MKAAESSIALNRLFSFDSGYSYKKEYGGKEPESNRPDHGIAI
jgi:hypothetical protein